MHKKTSSLLALTLAMCTLAPAVVAHDGGRHGDELSQLNLTDAQRTTIHQIETTNAAQLTTLRKAVQTQQQAFDAMTPNQAGYQTTAESLAHAEADETQARVMEHARVNAQIYSVLTTSQQAQLAQLKAASAARRAQREQATAVNSSGH